MKKRLMFLALAAIGMAGCNGGFQKMDGGILYNIVDDKSGPSIKEGDFIIFNYTIKTDADSILQSSYTRGVPQEMVMQKVQGKGNIMSVFSLLSEGDSVEIKQNIDTMSKGRPRPKDLKGKYIVYDVRVQKIIAKGNLTDQVFQGRITEYMKGIADVAKAKEAPAIKKYIADKGLKVTTTASGLNYVITKQGSGPNAMPGDTAVVNYVGTFFNGKGFDTNIKGEATRLKLPINPMNPYKPIRFPLGAPGMIQGWTEAFQLFNKGTKATLVIPSSLAYGEQGNQIMGPYTPLVFDVELVDIVHPDPNAPKPKAPGMPQLQAQPATPQAAPAKK